MVRMFWSSSEEQKKIDRENNRLEMQKEHQRGALCLPFGIPIRCKVEQPKATEDYNGVQGVACWKSNGEVRQVVYNGVGGKSYGKRWAGNAKGDEIGRSKPNMGEYPPDYDPGDMAYHVVEQRDGNDTSYIQAARAKKGKGVTGKRGGKREGAGRKRIKAPS